MKRISRSAKGFTLIEILVVLVIISIIAAVAILSIQKNPNKQIDSLVNELLQTISLTEEEAILKLSVLGIFFNENRYQVMSYVTDKKTGSWQTLKTQTIPDGIEIRFAGQEEDDEKTSGPQIIISTSGDITPFTMYVGKKGNDPRYTISGEENGYVHAELIP